jgi:hypothetical protein
MYYSVLADVISVSAAGKGCDKTRQMLGDDEGDSQRSFSLLAQATKSILTKP